MQTNVFLGASADPILSSGNLPTPTDYDAKIAELQAIQQRLELQRQQLTNNSNNCQNGNTSPTWDEIEKITAELTDREFEIINANEDYQQSQQAIATIMQREQLRIMRPIVERTQDGKQALDAHLALVKRLRKDAAHEVNKSMELFSEYTQHYSDMTYAEFLKQRKIKKPNKPCTSKTN